MKGIASNTSFLLKTHSKKAVAVMNGNESYRQGRDLSFPPGTLSAADSRTRAAGAPGTFDDCPEFRQLSAASAFFASRFSVFSIAYEWQRNCAASGARFEPEDQMLRIQREANGEVVLRISGRLGGENLAELKKLIDAEGGGRHLILDLRELTLVDHEAVGFLKKCDSDDITLQNCPPYIREWMARQSDGK